MGKTTVTANLAGELAARGCRVLLLDMDPQASLTFSLVTPDEWDRDLKDGRTVKEWFDPISRDEPPPPLVDLIHRPPRINDRLGGEGDGCVDLIASHLQLINVDLELASLLAGATPAQTRRRYLNVHGRLRRALERVAEVGKYDVALIDCPPNFNIVTKNSLAAADWLLIPAKPDYLSTLGVNYLKASVDDLLSHYNYHAKDEAGEEPIRPEILGVVFTMIQVSSGEPIAAQRQYIASTRRLGFPTFDNWFRVSNTVFASAPQNGLPVVLTPPTNPTVRGVVGEIEEFVTEFVDKAGVDWDG